jgi:hypothetical protein
MTASVTSDDLLAAFSRREYQRRLIAGQLARRARAVRGMPSRYCGQP